MSFVYDHAHGNTSLKQHALRYHAEEYKALMKKVESSRPPKHPRKASATNGADGTVQNFYRSSKKLKKSSPRARLFLRLLTMLIVFCRLPFNIVCSPIFKAFVWFLDPSVPFPTRTDVTGKHMQTLRADTEAALKALIKDVHGVAVTFDLWMSKKTDDILSLDVHFVSHDWVWHHKHLGLVAMNGQTTGVLLPN